MRPSHCTRVVQDEVREVYVEPSTNSQGETYSICAIICRSEDNREIVVLGMEALVRLHLAICCSGQDIQRASHR